MTQKTGGYEFLWDGSEEGWVVVRTKNGPGAIYNTMTRQALVIEDDDEHEHAIRNEGPRVPLPGLNPVATTTP
ncbi:hypothetical protein [Streptomyces sp. CoH17]|uniref:hypothetical protein n=1 Tax=Streptomyces sp. CoH17 TaxID=2992806 RepID=UPI002270B81A|nr:hypothetical protein [Streptomyces sp. CoH17]